jgi:hypothetical protein
MLHIHILIQKALDPIFCTREKVIGSARIANSSVIVYMTMHCSVLLCVTAMETPGALDEVLTSTFRGLRHKIQVATLEHVNKGSPHDHSY